MVDAVPTKNKPKYIVIGVGTKRMVAIPRA